MIGRYAAVVLLSGVPVMAEAQEPKQRARDRDLTAAGFIMRPADTPARRERLKAIPPYRFAARTADGRRYYVYADPADCVCAFVGTQQALDSYRDMMKPPAPLPGMRDLAPLPPGPVVEHEMIHEMDEDAGLMDGNDIFHLNFD